MSYSKDHSRKNPLAPSRMYGMSSSANTNTTPIDNQPIVTTERTTREGVEGTLTTKKIKPRKSKLPLVGMEEAYDRALKLGYRDENESFEDYVIRANKFNEGSTEESFVEDEKKQELLPMEKIDAKLIDTSSRMPSLRTIQTSVPEEGMASSMSPDKPKQKRDFNFSLPDINLPKISLPTFQKKPKKTKSVYGIGKNGMQKTRKKNKNTQGRRKKKNKR